MTDPLEATASNLGVTTTLNQTSGVQQQQYVPPHDEDERLTRAVKLVRQMSSPNLKEQCLRTEWSSLQTDLERDLLCSVVSERTFWEDVKEIANDDILEQQQDSTGEDEVDIDQRMLQMFKIFDKDGSGAIDAGELHQMLLYMGVPLADAEVREMIAQVDSDQDGAINENEFLHVMKHVLPQKTQQQNEKQAAAAAAQKGAGGVQPIGAPSLTAANLASAQKNMDAQREIRAANVEKDELTSRASEAAAEP